MKAITVFSGMGGSALGIKNAGLEEVLFLDYNKHACEMLKLNFPEVPHIINDSIENWTGNKILKETGLKPGELFLYQSSAPCQDFSIANRKNVSATTTTTRKSLFWNSIEHIEVLKPHAYVFENVVGILSDETVFLPLLETLYDMDYYFNVFNLNSIGYGSAQSRPRVFFIGYRKDLVDKLHKDDDLAELITKRLDPAKDKMPTRPPEITPNKDQQIKIVDIIPDAELYYSTFGRGIRKNPKTSSMPTILTQPTFLIIRKDDDSDNVFDVGDESDMIFDLSDKKTMVFCAKNALLADREQYKNEIKMKLKTFKFKFGKQLEKYLPTIEQLLQFSDFPKDWKVVGTFDDIWSRCGDIVLPKMMEAIVNHIRKELNE